MEHVVGAQRNVATVCIGADDNMEERRAEIHRCIDTVDTGDGVVLLTDMFGGTPSNLAISQMDRKGVEVIAGVNLPMLVKLAKVRSQQLLADAVDCAQDAGRKYIAAASHVLPHCRVGVHEDGNAAVTANGACRIDPMDDTAAGVARVASVNGVNGGGVPAKLGSVRG